MIGFLLIAFCLAGAVWFGLCSSSVKTSAKGPAGSFVVALMVATYAFASVALMALAVYIDQGAP